MDPGAVRSRLHEEEILAGELPPGLLQEAIEEEIGSTECHQKGIPRRRGDGGKWLRV
jgi:hypothetical protein